MGNHTIDLHIRVSPTGNIQVTGPIDNPVQCLGLLEIAKVQIIEHNKKKQESKIIVPTIHIAPANGGR